jgi:hypothetical protein
MLGSKQINLVIIARACFMNLFRLYIIQQLSRLVCKLLAYTAPLEHVFEAGMKLTLKALLLCKSFINNSDAN